MSLVVFLHAVAGFTLGWARPLWALAGLIGLVSVTSSFWWQIGLPNLATPFVYTAALLLGFLVRTALSARRPEAPHEPGTSVPGQLQIAVGLSVLTVAVATLLALFRGHATTGAILLDEIVRSSASLVYFNPPGLAGEIQAAALVIAGPLLLLVTIACRARHEDSLLLRRALTSGLVLAVAAPGIQFLFLNPLVRPDRGLQTSTGLVGFFQDPHSFAAYLVLGIGFASGMALWHAGAKQRRRSAAYAALAVAAFATVIGTNSLTGVAAAVLSIALVGIIWRYRPGATESAALIAKPLVLAVAGTAAVVTVAALLIISVPQLRQGTYTAMQQVGLQRLSRPLHADADIIATLGNRPLRWRQGMIAVAERPLWGLGPNQFRHLPIPTRVVRREESLPDAAGPSHEEAEPPQIEMINPENAHNYFLQFAAEYGIPAFLAWVFLVGYCIKTPLAGMLRRPDGSARGFLAGAIAGQIGLLAFSLLSHPLLLTELQAVFWTISGLAVATTVTFRD